jgi:site-specific recombinase XerD
MLVCPTSSSSFFDRAEKNLTPPREASGHILSQASGRYLANAGQDTRAIQLYLGHKNIQHTVRYTELEAGRFKHFWKD